MKKEKIYIALFKDCAIMLSNVRPPHIGVYGRGTRVFQVDEDQPILTLSEWIGNLHEHKKVKEITGEIPE